MADTQSPKTTEAEPEGSDLPVPPQENETSGVTGSSDVWGVPARPGKDYAVDAKPEPRKQAAKEAKS